MHSFKLKDVEMPNLFFTPSLKTIYSVDTFTAIRVCLYVFCTKESKKEARKELKIFVLLDLE